MKPLNKRNKLVRPFFNWLAAMVIFGLLPVGGFAQTNNQETNFPTRTRRPMPEPANPKLPSLFLIGDSTVRNGQCNGAGGQWGWGDFLAPFFDTNRLNVVNRALGGTSSRTFYRDQWPRVLAMLKPGDFVIMQFGHNDGSAVNDASRARGTIKGVSDESQAITNLITKKFEVVHSLAGMKNNSSPRRARRARRRWFVRSFRATTGRTDWPRETKMITLAGRARLPNLKTRRSSTSTKSSRASMTN